MHKVTAVVFDPQVKRVDPDYVGEIFEIEVERWHEAIDQLLNEWQTRHPMPYRVYGVDDLHIRAMSIMKIDD